MSCTPIKFGANINSGKPEIYMLLSDINQLLQAALDKMERLKAVEALSPSIAEVGRLTVEELRSQINVSASIRLHTSECDHAYVFQKQRLMLEKELKVLAPLPPQSEILVLPVPIPDDEADEN